jgi:hypothetical protein
MMTIGSLGPRFGPGPMTPGRSGLPSIAKLAAPDALGN